MNIKSELSFYGLWNYDRDGILIKPESTRSGTNAPVIVPHLYIDGKPWMSISPLEIQTHEEAVILAHGRVGVAGLGLGYFVNKIMSKEDVDSIVVCEIDERIINFFFDNFYDRAGFDKIEFILGDARDKFANERFDFLFVDIYERLNDRLIQEDKEIFGTDNVLYWGEIVG